jgi:1,4-alpha-glucan branching enzyme
VLSARRAVEAARGERHFLEAVPGPTILPGGRVLFAYHDDGASAVALAGEFNGWRPEPMEPCADGAWRREVRRLSPGSYRYKLVVDNRWIEDPANGAKEPDPYGSFNSLLRVS